MEDTHLERSVTPINQEEKYALCCWLFQIHCVIFQARNKVRNASTTNVINKSYTEAMIRAPPGEGMKHEEALVEP